MDRDKMRRGIQLFVEGLGERFEHDDLEKTPARVAKAWEEDLVAGYASDPLGEVSWTPAPPGTGPVLVRQLRFASICVHHLLPFFGEAHVAYLPDERLAGLSKFGRVIDGYARRLQTQEHLIRQVVDGLTEVLQPRGVLVLMEAEHTCMTLRGVRKEGGKMITTAATGLYERDAQARAEILRLLSPGS